MVKLFGRVLEIVSGNVKITNENLDIEFEVPFDDDLTPNLSEVRVFNLSQNTINNLKVGQQLTLNGGYKGDKGVLLKGRITNVKTPKIGTDRLTVIKVLDSVPYNAKKKLTKTWKNGIKANALLNDLAKAAGLKIAVIKLSKNVTYEKGYSIDGNVIEEIQNIAKDCGVSAYISRGNIYIRSLKEGDNHNFILNKTTGLVGSPEYFEEEMDGMDGKVSVRGYKIKSLLQHRMNTASIINLEAVGIKAKLRVRKGKHHGKVYGSDFFTEVEAIL
ncbi:phage protein [Lysinibacillus sp. 54212]|uniref:phage protein n=1 Tax=Lysinibacillus sp. 54212 TaxID=3119829 RepID=UPI002FC59146